MFPNLFQNTLSPLAWTALALVPPAILALYFLKLKRIPLEVPSTYLWRKSLEDMHVNSLWQRLRKSLLLFLQLLMVALAIFALLRPGWQSTAIEGERFIFMIDNSASMSASDVGETRLADAKKRALDVLDSLDSDSTAMILTFAGRPQVVQAFTKNQSLLRKQLKSIAPTAERTELLEAMQIANGLANPARVTIEEETETGDKAEVDVVEARPATVYIFSDGRFAKVENFSLGNLSPKFIPIGTPDSENLAVTALSTRRHETRPGQRQAFGRILNAGGEETAVVAELYLDDRFLDAKELTVPAGESRGIVFPLADPQPGALELRLSAGERRDDLSVDNTGYAAIEEGTTGKVLVITIGNEWLETALSRERTARIVTIDFALPGVLESEAFQKAAAGGVYDLILFDQCAPKTMPRTNTIFLGSTPPIESWQKEATETVESPLIVDWRRSHPVMAHIELGNVLIMECQTLSLPQGGQSLVDSREGSIVAIAPREQFQDVVLGFPIIAHAEGSEGVTNTNWPLRLSFPVFWLNVVEYLAGQSEETGGTVHRPGEAFEFAVEGAAETLTVVSPDGKSTTVHRGKHNLYQFLETDVPGVYTVRNGESVVRRFAVNLFDRQESSTRIEYQTVTQDGKEITVVSPLEIGFVQVEGQPDWRPTRRELWPWLIGAALVVLLFEWYVYNRRVYL